MATHTKILSVMFGISLVLFIVFSIFHEPSRYQISGAISEAGDHEVNYGIKFATPPQLEIVRNGDFDYTVTEQTDQHFKVTLRNYYYGGALAWTASGLPLASTDPRSFWEGFGLVQKVFSLSAILTFIGLLADMLGIFDFFQSRYGRLRKVQK